MITRPFENEWEGPIFDHGSAPDWASQANAGHCGGSEMAADRCKKCQRLPRNRATLFSTQPRQNRAKASALPLQSKAPDTARRGQPEGYPLHRGHLSSMLWQNYFDPKI